MSLMLESIELLRAQYARDIPYDMSVFHIQSVRIK